MSLTRKLRGELLKIRIEAYKLTTTSLDLAVINSMSAVVEFADRARKEDSLYYAELAKKNYELGRTLIENYGKE